MTHRMRAIDGGQGEGGGQIFRTALALASIQGVPVEIRNIRTQRPVPGLQAQHLAALRVLQDISRAQVTGAEIGSQRVTFIPGTLQPGEYRIDVGTAGAVGLVLQAIVLPLSLAAGPSRVRLTGGTHVPWSPSADYLRDVLLPALRTMGIRSEMQIRRWGFYPKGGGEVTVEIEGGAQLRPLTAVRRSQALRVRGVSAVANLPREIAVQEAEDAQRQLEREGWTADIQVSEVRAADEGSFLTLVADGGGLPAGFSALGGRGRSPGELASAAVRAFLEFAKSEASCEPYLADQLVLAMSLARGTSRITTLRITPHLLTTIQQVQHVLGCPVEVRGDEGSPGTVTIEGVGGAAAAGAARASRPVAQRPQPPAGAGGGSSVRKAAAADVPGMQRLLAHFAARGEVLPRTLNELYQRLRDFFVCDLNGEIIGICALSIYWEDLAEVRSLAVQGAHAGKGLGSMLVEACVAEAAALGIRRVFALTYRPGFFEKLHFHVIDKQELPQKIWQDCLKCAKFTCCDEVALIRET